MRDITLALDRIGAYVLMLGRVGENRATQVTIDMSSVIQRYPDAIGSITVKQPDNKEYPAVVTQADGMLTWVITSADIGDKPGTGAAQITVRSADGTIIKTAIAATRVEESLGSPQTPASDPVKGWVANAEEILADVERSGTAAQTIADEVKRKLDAGELTGEPGRDGAKGEPGDPGKDGATGATGATPQIKAEATTGEPGTQVSVTQSGTPENPVLSFVIPRGEPGRDGAKGDKGEPGKDAPQEAVLYIEQTLSEAQKTRARENIGAADDARQNILVGSETGNPIAVDDAFAAPLCGLTVYGKSTQDGTPSPDNPVPIVSAGDGGTIVVTLSDGNDKTQTITLQPPNGLRGIPVTSGGNYIDPQGQQWVCDEVDLEKGAKIQRVKVKELSPDDKWTYRKLNSGNNNFQTRIYNADVALVQKPCFCNILPFKNVIWNDDTRNLPKIYANDQEITVSFPPSSEYSSLEVFKQLLTNVKSVIYYPLATPIETPLTDAEIAAYKALTTYASDTVVQASDGAGIKLEHQRDVNIVVKKLEDAIASMTAT